MAGDFYTPRCAAYADAPFGAHVDPGTKGVGLVAFEIEQAITRAEILARQQFAATAITAVIGALRETGQHQVRRAGHYVFAIAEFMADTAMAEVGGWMTGEKAVVDAEHVQRRQA